MNLKRNVFFFNRWQYVSSLEEIFSYETRMSSYLCWVSKNMNNQFTFKFTITFMNVFSTLQVIFKVLIMVLSTKVNTFKIYINVENTCTNKSRQFGLNLFLNFTSSITFNKLSKLGNVLLPFLSFNVCFDPTEVWMSGSIHNWGSGR